MRDGEDVACEAEPELRRDRAAVAHAVDREAEQDDVGLPLREQALERRLVDVVLELGLRDPDVHDLVDAVAAHVERGGIVADHGHRYRASELPGRRDELVGHVAHGALQLFRDDKNAHESRSFRSSAIRCATCAASPSISSAPAPRGGANMRRTR